MTRLVTTLFAALISTVVLATGCRSSDRVPARDASASTAPSGTTVAPARASRIACAAEIVFRCPSGYENGCAGDRTTRHVCLRDGVTATVPCEKQIVLDCPPGEIDSCEAKPPYGVLHVCVKP